MHGETVINEIKELNLAEDEGCIVFDFGCFFPYSNPECLTFEFSLGMEEFKDCKLNHRYPNRGYHTISKKFGRKVSKIGYPYVFKLNEQSAPCLLCVRVGIKEKYVTLIFPMLTTMTKEKPVCGLSLHYYFDDNRFLFESEAPTDDGGWIGHRWYSSDKDINEINEDYETILSMPNPTNNHTLIYQECISPYPTIADKLLLI